MANEKFYRQVELQRGPSSMVCWLEDEPRLPEIYKKKRLIELKEIPGRKWEIVWLASTTVRGPMRKSWHVGGL